MFLSFHECGQIGLRGPTSPKVTGTPVFDKWLVALLLAKLKVSKDID